MPDLNQRSLQLEMLDLPVKDEQELMRSLSEISLINKLLGGDRVSIKGLKKLLLDRSKTYRIVDIGCGDGGMLRRIWHWAKKQGYSVEILGIDINPVAIRYAKEKSIGYPGLNYLVVDYADYFAALEHKPDIIISALFCHHLENERLREFLQMMAFNSRKGFVVNDLHRHCVAYYSIKWLTVLFSRSVFTRNDAPVSVTRGFKKKELIRLLDGVAIKTFEISWHWAFRFLIVSKTQVL
jgi:2-polyprenyl-3-methyl-5-hydroxy-6-metoxy-1,4-benzoquinol methylase